MSPYKNVRRKGSRTTYSEHTVIAENALGRCLPENAEVHHIDSNRRNNTHENLVICPNHSYHMLLHRRTKALDGCGNASWLRCGICKEWSPPDEMKALVRNHHRGGSYLQTWHTACDTERARERRKKQDIASMEVK